MSDCVIFAARPVAQGMLCHVPAGAFLIAADGGWRRMEQWNLRPHLALGDFDSSPPPGPGSGIPEILRLPAAKDDTDTHAAARQALDRGYKSVTILGGLGGRPDHTFANLQTLLFLARGGARNLLADENTEWRCLAPGTFSLQARPGWGVSVFAAGGPAQGVTLRGLRYPLRGASLAPQFPVGVSNQFAEETAEISCEQGYLYVAMVNLA